MKFKRPEFKRPEFKRPELKRPELKRPDLPDMPDVRTLLRHRIAILVVVLAAVAGLYGVAAATRPGAAAAAPPVVPERLPVESAMHACPAPSKVPGISTTVSAITPSTADRTGEGRADIRELNAPANAPSASLHSTGVPWYQESKGRSQPLVLHSSGTMAGGLQAEQTTVHDDYIAAERCPEPGLDFWFAAPGGAEAEALDLYLLNVDDGPAVVDVDVLTPEGRLADTSTLGLRLEPHSRQVLPLKTVSKLAGAVALRVRTSTGRVAPSLLVREGDRGTDWVPPAAQPARRVVLPGLPPGRGDRKLVVATPSDELASVHVRVITEDGAYIPDGRGEVDVAGASTATVDLASGLSGRAATVELTADVPITAGLIATEGGHDGGDTAYPAAADPVQPAGVIADNRSGKKQATRVVMTAPTGPATVKLTPIGPNGPGRAQTVELPMEKTRTVKVAGPGPAGGHFAVLVEVQPGSAPVYAARVLTDGDRLGVFPVVSARAWVKTPRTTDSAGALTP
ncbi:MAG: hypothetical protein GEV11_05715 [Streptosporangiales bacterium]|nr:hypothetical protein [Streptosporangiales bacterium]